METATRPQSLRERQRQEREELILRAAEELLLECGYQETSIDDIAARVGIAKGTVYLHFASKEDIVIALVERGTHEALCSLEPIFHSDDSPREKLRAVIEQLYGNMADRRFRLLAAVFQSPEFLGRMAEKHRALSEAWREPMRRVAVIVEEGKAAGEFDASMPTPVVLSVLGSLMTPHSYRLLVVEKRVSSDIVVAHLTNFFLKGIAAGEPGCPTQVGGDEA